MLTKVVLICQITNAAPSTGPTVWMVKWPDKVKTLEYISTQCTAIFITSYSLTKVVNTGLEATAQLESKLVHQE